MPNLKDSKVNQKKSLNFLIQLVFKLYSKKVIIFAILQNKLTIKESIKLSSCEHLKYVIFISNNLAH